MKKWISLIMIMVLLLPTVSFATGGYDNFTVTESDLTQDGDNIKFMLRYKIDNPKKGATYNIQTPFPITINGGEYLDVWGSGGNYTLEVKEDMDYITGGFGGTKAVIKNETLPALIVDGKVIIDEKPVSPGGSNSGGDVGEREEIYKRGQEAGDGRLFWDVNISHKNGGVQNFSILDELGDGHIIDKESVSLVVRDSNGQIMGGAGEAYYEHYVRNLLIEDNAISFNIEGLPSGAYLSMNYYTKITDTNRGTYSNQLIVNDAKKISSDVVIEDWSDIDGEKPDPTEPEEPKEESVDIEVVKVWRNSNGEEISGDEVKEITVILLQDGKESKRIKLNPANGWVHTFEDLPKHNEDGSEINYSVKELEIVGYTSSVERNDNTFTITNTKDEPTQPELPQVGEGLFKKEYLIGLVLLVLAILISKQNKRA